MQPNVGFCVPEVTQIRRPVPNSLEVVNVELDISRTGHSEQMEDLETKHERVIPVKYTHGPTALVEPPMTLTMVMALMND